MYSPFDDVIEISDIDYDNKKLFGEELSSLGELANSKIHITPSFIITPSAFEEFKEENDLDTKIKHLLGTLTPDRHDSVAQISKLIQDYINKSAFPNSFVKKIFSKLDYYEKKYKKLNLNLSAVYTHSGVVQKRLKMTGIKGESELLTNIRELWAYSFEHKLVSQKDISHNKLDAYKISTYVEQKTNPKVIGYIKTLGDKNEKHLFVIEALNTVRVEYNKRSKKIEGGIHLNSGWQNVISNNDLKRLIEIAEIADKKLYYPHIIFWGKDEEIYITSVKPVTHKIDYYSKLESIKGAPLHPGIRIGRARLIEKNHDNLLSNEEVVIVRTLTKPLLDSIKRAAAIISEDSLNHEIKFYLKERGIPTIEKAHDAYKSFKNGEVVTVDATTGEVKHGSLEILN